MRVFAQARSIATRVTLLSLCLTATAVAQVATTPPAQNSAIVPAPFQPARHQAFLDTAKKGDIDLLLMGDSITDWWARAGAEMFTKYFGGIKCANFGIAGDKTQGVLWRMQNGELEGYTPKVMMLMIGTNNIGGPRGGGNTPEQIAEGITAVVNTFRTKFPMAKVLLLGVFPRAAQATSPYRESIKQINAIIAKLDDGGRSVRYMDIGDKFLAPDGSISTEIMADGLHPTAKGYDIWGQAVMPTLKEMLSGK